MTTHRNHRPPRGPLRAGARSIDYSRITRSRLEQANHALHHGQFAVDLQPTRRHNSLPIQWQSGVGYLRPEVRERSGCLDALRRGGERFLGLLATLCDIAQR